MKLRSLITATLLGIASIPVLPPLEAQACYKYNPFCRNPIIRRTIDNAEREWVRQRDNVTDQFSGHICKQNLLSAKRRAGAPLRSPEIDKALSWIRASGVFRDIDLNRLEFRFAHLTNASMMTHGHTIYIDPANWQRFFRNSDTGLAVTIAHELGHVRQYKRYGTTEKFCRAYEKNIASNGNFVSFHQLGSMETEADRAEYTFIRWMQSARVFELALYGGGPTFNHSVYYDRNTERRFRLPHRLPTVDEWRWREHERRVQNKPIFINPQDPVLNQQPR